MEEPASSSSIVEMIEKKYLDEYEPPSPPLLSVSPSIELPSKMRQLSLIVLNHMRISSIGDEMRFRRLAGAVREFDLAWNSISDWMTMGTVLSSLPHLRILNISYNPLDKISDAARFTRAENLHTLILNGTNLPLQTLRAILRSMPALVELHLSDNEAYGSEPEQVLKVDTVGGPPAAASDTVKTLHLNRCKLNCWRTTRSLVAQFPGVETVYLCENPIEDVSHVPENENAEECAVRMLNLSKSSIGEWKSIDALAKFSKLCDLRINSIPLLDCYTEEERLHLVIGRLPKLTSLNGSAITAEQRETSERFFIRYYEERNDKPAAYHQLLQKHGKLEKLAKVDLSPKEHASVSVICEEKEYSEAHQVPLKQTVKDFVTSLASMLGIPAPQIRLFHCGPDNFCNELRYPNLPLYSFHVDDEDKFYVQSKPQIKRKKVK